MDDIIETFNKYTGYKGKRDDDWFDRLNNRYTVIVILVFAGLITFYQLGDEPIACWCPVHFSEAWEKYTNSYCWVRNTYYLPFEDEVPPEDAERQTVLYYQWVPFILLSQAFFFFAPSLVWHGLNNKGGIDADSILQTANKLTETKTEESRGDVLASLTRQIDRFLSSRVQQGGGFGMSSKIRRCCVSTWNRCGRRFSSYLLILFLFTKLLYIANVIGQFFVLNKFLFHRFNLYGFAVLGNVAADHDWHDSPMDAFPRVTLCDFSIRRLGNVHRYTVQCALPLNLWNEKAYMFLWFWMTFVAAATVFGFFQWLVRALFPGDNIRFVTNHLHTYRKIDSKTNPDEVSEFTYNYLRTDGVFLLQLISHNTNSITTTEVTCALWDIWADKPKKGAMKALDVYANESDDEVT